MKKFTDELQTPTLKRAPDRSVMGAEVGALNSLMNMLNDPRITGASAPQPGDDVETPLPVDPAVAASQQSAKQPAAPQTRPAPAAPAARPAPRAITTQRFAFTGRLMAGKDYCAAAIGAKIFGFAEPLYVLQDHFFGTDCVNDPKQKDLPGARSFLQTVGQWGWGALDDKYPLTPARACFVTMIRSLGAAGIFPAHLHVDWEKFGKVRTLWVDAAFKRIEGYLAENSAAKVAIVNARFVHEFEPLKAAGFEHWHVMCSPKTWEARLRKRDKMPGDAAVNDKSEHLAMSLDRDVIKKISAQRSGPMLRVIWNDEAAPPPSPRLYTTAQFLQSVAIDASTVGSDVSVTDDNYAARE